MNILHRIASIPLFQDLPETYHKDLAMILVEQRRRRGEWIFSEGDEGTGFYVVASGRVKVFKLSPEGKEQLLHLFGSGEPFGEVAVFEGTRFPAHASALEESLIYFFPRDAFIGLIRKNPDLALKMLGVLSRRLRRFTALIEDLSLKEVPGRLAAYLIYLREKKKGTQNLELEMSKSQLASLLGTIPETLSRIFQKMIKAEFIAVDGPRITILDDDGLKALAEAEARL